MRRNLIGAKPRRIIFFYWSLKVLGFLRTRLDGCLGLDIVTRFFLFKAEDHLRLRHLNRHHLAILAR